MKISSLFLFTIFLFICLQGALIVVNSLTSDYIGNLVYFWEIQTNNTFTNSSGSCMNVSLQRMSETADPWLNLTYVGGNVSDQVFVNGNYVGTLSPPGPDVISFNPNFLAVSTCVDFGFANEGATNVTNMSLVYYRWDGCNYDEDMCDSMNSIRTLTNVSLWFSQWQPIMLAVLLIFFVIAWLSGGGK